MSKSKVKDRDVIVEVSRALKAGALLIPNGGVLRRRGERVVDLVNDYTRGEGDSIVDLLTDEELEEYKRERGLDKKAEKSKTVMPDMEKVRERVKEERRERMLSREIDDDVVDRIIKAIEKCGGEGVSRGEVLSQGIKVEEWQQNISQMVEMGIVERRGLKKGARYYV